MQTDATKTLAVTKKAVSILKKEQGARTVTPTLKEGGNCFNCAQRRRTRLNQNVAPFPERVSFRSFDADLEARQIKRNIHSDITQRYQIDEAMVEG